MQELQRLRAQQARQRQQDQQMGTLIRQVDQAKKKKKKKDAEVFIYIYLYICSSFAKWEGPHMVTLVPLYNTRNIP